MEINQLLKKASQLEEYTEKYGDASIYKAQWREATTILKIDKAKEEERRSDMVKGEDNIGRKSIKMMY